ncbi:hypothetical protein [Jannaschia pohangensis]|uniref:Tissue inhibitor of metalloproteinase n=1 Tax=Jannaschia pohangensis TaxID=390807 RepID=A0A1I3T3A4_9RHOB|nr:hypothetical protein [Jannaschia pohangensis]SFJ65638.1 hypothetical protein SAMN04488095_3284 [Jannaschia pohangensis]
MTRLILASLLSTAIAGQASALSCLRADVARTFATANEAEAQYVIAVGTMRLLPGESIPEQAGDPNEKQGYSVKTRFDGRLAALDGFTQDAAFPLTVEVECAGPWCGGVPVNRVLVFIERRGDENVLVEGPCPQFAIPATTETLDSALSCLRGEACEAGDF